MKSAARNCVCLQRMWAAAVMSVAEGVFLPQEVTLPQVQERPLLRLDPPLHPPGAQALLEAKAQGAAPKELQAAAL